MEKLHVTQKTMFDSKIIMNLNIERIRYFLPTVISILLAVFLLCWLLQYASFYALSYFFWFGIVIILVGLISLIKPMRFLLIFKRSIASIVFCGGLFLSVSVLLWPAPLLHTEGSTKHIDIIMPDYSFQVYNEIEIQASPKKVMQAARQVSLSEMPPVLFLLRLRAFAMGKNTTISQAQLEKPVLNRGNLVNDTNEIVIGLIKKTWASVKPPRVKEIEQFESFKYPGYVRVACNLYVRNLDNGNTVLCTETRIQANDKRSRHIFSRYWRIIYIGCAITRKVMLDVIAARSETLS